MNDKRGVLVRVGILTIIVLIAFYFYGDSKKPVVSYEEGNSFLETLLDISSYEEESKRSALEEKLKTYFTEEGYTIFQDKKILEQYSDFIGKNKVRSISDITINKESTGKFKDFLNVNYIVRYKLQTDTNTVEMKDMVRVFVEKPNMKIKDITLHKSSSILK